MLQRYDFFFTLFAPKREIKEQSSALLTEKSTHSPLWIFFIFHI